MSKYFSYYRLKLHSETYLKVWVKFFFFLVVFWWFGCGPGSEWICPRGASTPQQQCQWGQHSPSKCWLQQNASGVWLCCTWSKWCHPVSAPWLILKCHDICRASVLLQNMKEAVQSIVLWQWLFMSRPMLAVLRP